MKKKKKLTKSFLHSLLIFLLAVNISVSNAQKKGNNLFSLESQHDKENVQNPNYYPSLKVNEENYNLLRDKAFYPKQAKEKRLTDLVLVKFSVDTLGQTNNISISDLNDTLFAQSAIELINASSGIWNPAIRNNQKVTTFITIPINYSIYFNTLGKLIYNIQFTPYVELIVDSSANSTPLLKETDKDGKNTFYFTSKEIDVKSVLLGSKYGTVTLKFQVDSQGIVSNITTLHSISEELDNHAIKYIKSSSGKWIPAQENGTNLNSTIEFDMRYYLYRSQNSFAQSKYSYNDRKELAHYADYKLARKHHDDGDFNLAEPLFNKACNYLVRSPEAFYYQALNYARLKKKEEACQSMKIADELAKKYGYRGIMEKHEIEDFISSYCPEQNTPEESSEKSSNE